MRALAAPVLHLAGARAEPDSRPWDARNFQYLRAPPFCVRLAETGESNRGMPRNTPFLVQGLLAFALWLALAAFALMRARRGERA